MTTPLLRRSLLGALLGAVLATAASGSATAAQPVPFTDPNVVGALGFCDRKGQPVTSGTIDTKPFVWTYVSSAPAPSGYTKGLAAAYAYSPIPGLQPGDWSPYAMTSASLFTNSTRPMAQSTPGDPPLDWQVNSFPPVQNGFVQVRMYYTGPNLPEYSGGYPAAVIQVTGRNWKLVDGEATPDCKAGKATSFQTIALDPSAFATPTSGAPSGPASGKPSPGAASSGSPASSAGSGSDPESSDPESSVDPSAIAASGDAVGAAASAAAAASSEVNASNGMAIGAVVGLAALILAAVGIGVAAVMRRKPQ